MSCPSFARDRAQRPPCCSGSHRRTRRSCSPACWCSVKPAAASSHPQARRYLRRRARALARQTQRNLRRPGAPHRRHDRGSVGRAERTGPFAGSGWPARGHRPDPRPDPRHAQRARCFADWCAGPEPVRGLGRAHRRGADVASPGASSYTSGGAHHSAPMSIGTSSNGTRRASVSSPQVPRSTQCPASRRYAVTVRASTSTSQ